MSTREIIAEIRQVADALAHPGWFTDEEVIVALNLIERDCQLLKKNMAAQPVVVAGA